jgi:uncharacterized protein YlzI (FlbEa/FlbD family)
MFNLVAVLFIIVHAPDGQEVQINVAEISSIRRPRDADGHFADGANCILTMGNGKFNLTTETCLEVINKIAEVNKE